MKISCLLIIVLYGKKMNTSNTTDSMLKGIIALLVIVYFSISVSAQTATLSIGRETVCAGQEVLVPVFASNINDLAAITLYIGFDPDKLNFIGLENIHPSLNGLIFSLNTVPLARIGIAWSNISPAQFSNEKIFDIKFLINSGAGYVVFKSGCQLADINLSVINTEFVDGEVVDNTPLITVQPVNAKVKDGQDVNFNLVTNNATGFSWYESVDKGFSWNTLSDDGKYSGVLTGELTIKRVTQFMNENRYKCVVNSANCTLHSESGILEVDSLTGLIEKQESAISNVNVSPNPCTRLTHIGVHFAEPGALNITIFDCLGNLINKIESTISKPGFQEFELNMASEKDGLYFFRAVLKSANRSSQHSGKILKRSF